MKKIGSKRQPTGSETGEPDLLSLSPSRQQLLRCTSGIFIVSLCVTSQTGFARRLYRIPLTFI